MWLGLVDSTLISAVSVYIGLDEAGAQVDG